jgi:hypothetical protein
MVLIRALLALQDSRMSMRAERQGRLVELLAEVLLDLI